MHVHPSGAVIVIRAPSRLNSSVKRLCLFPLMATFSVRCHFGGVFFNLGASLRPRHAVTCGERVRIRSGWAALYNVMDDATENV